MKKLLTILLPILMVCTLAGCTKSKDEGLSGELVVYSPNSDALVAVIEYWGQQNGVDVQVQSMKTGECLQRIVAETENPIADVMFGGVNYANSIDYADYFEKYTAAGDDKLIKEYQNTNGVTTHYCLDGSAALIVNTKKLQDLGLDADAIKGYADLLRPELKGPGKIAMGMPDSSSSAWAELTNMLLVMGDKPYDEKAWEWVGKFIDQLSGLIDSSSAIYKGVVSGEYVVGVSYEDPCISLLENGAENVKVVYPSEGAVWLPAGVAIVKNAKNMTNAKALVDWLISEEGQKKIAETTARPVNTEIANTSKNMIPFSEINLAFEDIPYCGQNKTAWQARWAQMYADAHK